MIRLIDQLLTVARAYADARKLSLSRVSTLVFNEGKKLTAISDGGDISTARFEAAMRWFATNWPEGARWPEGVARPEIAVSQVAS